MSQKGFTLIEILVYLGLFAIIMVGVISVAFVTFESNGRIQTKALIQEEGNFLIAKFNWALASAQAVALSGSTLDITKWDGSHSIFTLSSGSLHLGGVGLNNSRTEVVSLNYVNTGNGTPVEAVTVSFILQTKTPNGQSYSQDFTTTKYLRK